MAEPRSTVLRSFAGVVPGDPDAVFARLETLLREEGAPLAETDRGARFLAVQGGWWYRAEYTVLPDDAGSRIEHELLNVATRAHFAGPIAGRRVIADAPSAFGRILTTLLEGGADVD